MNMKTSKNSEDLVSVIITTKNRKGLLKKAIDSVLHQTYENIECIVVDDGSEDGTELYIQEYIIDNRVKYIRIDSDVSKGGNFARNTGILNSNGKYIAFLDDDDEWFPDKTYKQVGALNNSLDVGLVYCGRIFEYNFQSVSYEREEIQDNKFRDGDLSREVLTHIIAVTSTIMVKRNVLEDVGLFDEQLKAWQEYELTIRILQKYRAKKIPENLVLYRINLKDKNRNTNKIVSWEKSVKLIEDKHSILFKSLTFSERIKRNYYKNIDGFNRARNANAGFKIVIYTGKLLCNYIFITKIVKRIFA